MLASTKTAAALLVFWFVGLSSAHGAWRAVEGIDMASGQASLLRIGELDAQTGLYARCVAGEAEMFLDGFDGGDFEIAPVGPVNLIIATDSGKTWSSEARYGREKSGYVTTTWLTRETISAAIAELAAAKSAISISIEFADTGDVSTWDTDAKGSTAAARRFLDDCPQTRFSDEPESGAPQDAATWQTFTADAAEATLVGGLERNARLLATCDSAKNVTLSLVAPDLPYQIGDVGLNLHLEIDGEDRSSTGEVFDDVEGFKGVAYTGDYVANAITAIAGAQTEIKFKVMNYADGSQVEWRALDLQGLVAATGSFNATCFGTPPTQTVADSPTPPDSAPPRIQVTDASDPYTDWTTAIGDSVTLPDVRAVLMGRTSPASAMVQMTCGMDPQMWSVGLTATDPSAIAIRDTDGPFAISLTVDGTTWTFPDAQYLGSSTGLSVIADAGTDLAGALIMLTLSFNPAILTVTGASGQAHVYTAGVFGMAEASMAMSKACLG
jgi:hypothetical protein